MYYMIYLSAGTDWFDESELNDILTISNINNSRDGITGLLLYGDGNFIQLLEGTESDVQAAFQKISLDKRHKGVTVIASGPLKIRNFPQWAMGFKSINALSFASFEGYLNPAGNNFLSSKDGHIGINLLKAFVRTAGIAV